MKKIVLVTGGFDPIHSGHIAYFNAAKALGNKLSKNAGVGKDSYKAEQTFVGLSNIEYNLANFNSMSDLEKKKFLVIFFILLISLL